MTAWARIVPAAVVALALTISGAPVAQAAPTPGASSLTYTEQEAVGTSGANDTRFDAEPVRIGTRAGERSLAHIRGELADLSPALRSLAPGAEDDGSILQATNTGIDGVDGVSIDGVLGDGPHGPDGDATNDYDFYAVTVPAGLTLVADDTGTYPNQIQAFFAIYTADGTLLRNEYYDPRNANSHRVEYTSPTTARYFVLIGGGDRTSYTVPKDPFDSGSGRGGTYSGAFSASIAVVPTDVDYYQLTLAKGDVLGAKVTGGAGELAIFRPDGTQMITAPYADPAASYPPSSPLPRGGNTNLAYVAEKSGTYALRVRAPVGAYDADVRLFRPGTETDSRRRAQTIYLDFDGAVVNPRVFDPSANKSEPVALSPLSSFLANWGLTPEQEAPLIAKVTAVVRENVRADLIRTSSNRDVAVRVTSSNDSPDISGLPNVSRVVVGGTIAESGIFDIGCTPDVDPGNFDHEDQALVMLDDLSAPGQRPTGEPHSTKVPDGRPYSINTYLEASSNRVDFVGQALGNEVSHQVGRLLGVVDTDPTNTVTSLSDYVADGTLFGVGPDDIGGTADDVDVDFVPDDYADYTRLTGLENTANVAAWGLARRKTAS